MSSNLSRRSFGLAILGSFFTIHPGGIIGRLAPKHAGTARADGGFSPSQTKPSNSGASKKKDKKTHKYSSKEFSKLGSGSIKWLYKDVISKKGPKNLLVIKGFSKGFSRLLLTTSAASGQRRLVQRWMKKMAGLKSKKARRAYLKTEAAKLIKFRKSLTDSIKRLKKSGVSKAAIKAEENRRAGVNAALNLNRVWTSAIGEGQR